MAFKVRSKMVYETPENFKNKYTEETLKCSYCDEGNIKPESLCIISGLRSVGKGLISPTY